MASIESLTFASGPIQGIENGTQVSDQEATLQGLAAFELARTLLARAVASIILERGIAAFAGDMETMAAPKESPKPKPGPTPRPEPGTRRPSPEPQSPGTTRDSPQPPAPGSPSGGYGGPLVWEP
jgi:hypothetical protein